LYSYQYLCAKYLGYTLQPLMRSVMHAAYVWERKHIDNFGQKMWMETLLTRLRHRKHTSTLRHWTAVLNELCITSAFKCPTHYFAFKCTMTIVIIWCQRANRVEWKDVPLVTVWNSVMFCSSCSFMSGIQSDPLLRESTSWRTILTALLWVVNNT
jgi:hypothetical protein